MGSSTCLPCVAQHVLAEEAFHCLELDCAMDCLECLMLSVLCRVFPAVKVEMSSAIARVVPSHFR